MIVVLPKIRRSLCALAATAAVGLVVAASPSATPSGRTQFIITGGTVTIVLAQDFLNVLAADEATLSAGGGASITRTKSHQTVLTLHVLGGMATTR